MFAATVLISEAFVVFFAALAAYGLRAANPGMIIGVGSAAALACILAAGLLRRPIGYAIGSVLQVVLVGAGVLISDLRVHLLPVAVVFAALWVVSLRTGVRIDRERAERYQAELAHWRGGDATQTSL